MADAEEEEESVAPGSGAAEHERYEKAIEELRADRGAQGREEQRVPLAGTAEHDSDWERFADF